MRERCKNNENIISQGNKTKQTLLPFESYVKPLNSFELYTNSTHQSTFLHENTFNKQHSSHTQQTKFRL
jgi:hypothetical protein